MKSTLDILSTVYKTVAPTFEGKLTGKVYIGNPPTGDQLENVTLNILNNPSTYVQKGVLNANIEMMEMEKGRPNLRRFNELLEILKPSVHNKYVSAGDITVHLEIEDDKGVYPVQDIKGKYLYNLRVAFVAL